MKQTIIEITEEVRNCFIERNMNTIREKISECINRGMTSDNAHHTVIQVVKNLSNDLLPLKIKSSEENIFSDELAVNNITARKPAFLNFPPDDVSDLD